MTLLAEPLVGRDAELGRLEETLEQACGGASRFAVIVGEPGIGKTSVLDELGRRAQARGCLVLRGRASELESELPFGLVVDAFDAYLESLDARAHDRLAADGLGELASVFPSLRSLRAGAEPPHTPVERFRAHHAVRELIERLAARHPMVLELDDLHWSDGASLELLGHLLRRPPQAAVMIVAAFRTGQADPAFVAALERGARDGEVTSLALGPLARDAADALIARGGHGNAGGLYRESGGNPFYLLQLARADPARTRGAAGANGRSGGVPDAVAAAIAGELDRLPPTVRAFGQAAAVAGDPFELDLAAATAAVTEADALACLDELVARDLVRPTELPRRFQFRHPLVRSAIYASIAPGVRLAAHERSARTLAARGASAIARAHHVEQSARHGDGAAIAVLCEAGAAAAERAPSSAARWFEAALRLMPETAPAAERAGVLLALAGSWAATGRLEDSRGALLETLSLMPAEDAGGRVSLISACAGVEQLLGRHAEAHARLEDALQELEDHDSPEAAALMLDLAVDAFYGQDYEGMAGRGADALRLARALGDRPLMAAAGAIAAFACSCRPETIGAAHAYHDDAAAIVDTLSDSELAERLDAMAWLTPAEFYLDRYDEGIRHTERALAIARSTAQGQFFPGLTQALANMLFMTGRPAEAAELLDGVVEAGRLADSDLLIAWSLLNRSFAAVCAGDLETALRTGTESVSLARRLDDSPVAGWAGAALGRALLESGDAQRALQTFVDSCGGPDLHRVPGAWRAIWLETMTRCFLELGRHDDAAQAAQLAEELASRYGLPLAVAVAHRAAAAVALDAGDAATAAGRALASAAGAGELGARVEAAHSRALAGRALARLGETDRAIAELESAVAELEACGASRSRTPIERELRKLGRPVHRRSRPGRPEGTGVASLTGRELDVARLVVDRRTNQEIAAELFLSIKTVETHMRNIFRKLDAGSRVEVARILEAASR